MSTDERMYLDDIRVFKHPQGKTIIVHPDLTLECRGEDGKKRKTSATAEKLFAGFGEWFEVDA